MASYYVNSHTIAQSQSQTPVVTPTQHTPSTQDVGGSRGTVSLKAAKGSARERAYAAALVAATKAKWDPRSTEIFVRLCVTESQNGNRPGPHFSKIGWQNLVQRFNQTTRKSYTRKMLKNKWDVMRKDWGLWLKLTRNETGLGWDNVLGTIVADPEWWTRKLQVTPDAVKFRTRGPVLLEEQEMLFSDCVANGNGSWAPSSGILPRHMADDNVDDDAAEETMEEETEIGLAGDQTTLNEENGGFEDNVDARPHTATAEANCRRTRTFPPRSRVTKGKKPSTALMVVKCLQTMASKFDSINTQTCSCKGQISEASIHTCLTILDGLNDVVEGDELWMYATRIFLKPIVRELFVKMKSDRVRVLWLKNHMDRDLMKRGMSSTTSHDTTSRGLSCNNQNY